MFASRDIKHFPVDSYQDAPIQPRSIVDAQFGKCPIFILQRRQLLFGFGLPFWSSASVDFVQQKYTDGKESYVKWTTY